jgi:hypothetical protein
MDEHRRLTAEGFLDSSPPMQPRETPLDGVTIGAYASGTAPNLRRGGASSGGAPAPAVDPGIGEGGSTVSMTPGAMPLPVGTLPSQMAPTGTGTSQDAPTVAAGQALFAGMARPPQAQPPQPQQGGLPTATYRRNPAS